MSIVTEIESNRAKRVAMSNTKQDIKSAVNTDFEAIQNEQIEQYPNLIRNAINQYKSYIPVVTGEGKELSLNTVPLKPKEFAVKGDTFQQTYTGKNLFDYAGSKLELAQLDFVRMKIARSASIILSYIQCKPNTIYTISRRSPMSIRFQVGTTENEPVVEEPLLSIEVFNDSTTTSTTITTPANANYIIVRFIYNETTDYETYAKTIQIEEGSTATDFEPYVGGTPAPNPDYPQPIKVVTGEQTVVKRGKNFIPTQVEKWEQGTISANNGSKVERTYRIRTKNYISISTGIYTISVQDTNYQILNIVYYDTNKNFVSAESASGINLSAYTFTISNNNIAYYKVTIRKDDDTDITESVIATVKPMLEEGSTATDFEPYITPVELPLDLGDMELCKKEDYQDILFKNTINSEYYNSGLEENVWYKKKTIRKIICDGTETITKSTLSDVQNTQRFRLGSYSNQFIPSIGFSDKFIIKTADIRIGDFEFLQIGGTPTVFLYININLNRLTENTIDAFKTWLSNNNVTAYCVLESPQYEQITDETLISQLEAIEQTNMNNGTTIIYAENEEGLQPTLYLEAYAKAE